MILSCAWDAVQCADCDLPCCAACGSTLQGDKSAGGCPDVISCEHAQTKLTKSILIWRSVCDHIQGYGIKKGPWLGM